jgi:outer membrane protein OmpA-like peptidoglycan-associated protein
MTLRRACLAAVPVICAFASSALAQATLTEGQILNSLAGAGEAAAAVGVDIPAVQRAIEDGIRKTGGTNAVAPPPALQALAMLPNLTVEILFDFDSDRIQPASYHTMGRIADALHHPELAGYKFVVIGHTDAKGTRLYNLELSRKRALAVTEALSTTFRVPPSHLIALGVGEEQLADPSNPDAGANRRVQLLNLGPL